MTLKERTEHMLGYLASRLEKTGQFSSIDPGVRFISKTIDDSINNKHDEHVFAVKRPEFRVDGESGQYLIMTHGHEKQSEKPTERDFNAKIEAASKANIAVVCLLYKFLNNEGLYWRRKTLSQDAPHEGRRERTSWRKQSLDHIPIKVRNRMRILSTTLERDWVPRISFGYPMYYQPESTRLDERLIRFHFRPVIADYTHVDIPLITRQLKKTIDPRLYEIMDSFTLAPMKRSYAGPEGKQPGRIVAGDFLGLPDIEVTDDPSRMLQYRLGFLQHDILAAAHAPNPLAYSDFIDTQLERLYIQLEDRSDDLAEAMDKLIETHTTFLDRLLGLETKVTEVSFEKGKTVIEEPWEMHTFYYPSKSQPGTDHEASVLITTELPKEILYTCDCKGFKYWHRCWHTQDLKDKYETSDTFL